MKDFALIRKPQVGTEDVRIRRCILDALQKDTNPDIGCNAIPSPLGPEILEEVSALLAYNSLIGEPFSEEAMELHPDALLSNNFFGVQMGANYSVGHLKGRSYIRLFQDCMIVDHIESISELVILSTKRCNCVICCCIFA
jgi:hypothetical protein